MRVTVFGAAGPTGALLCTMAASAGHAVTAVSRRPDPLPLGADDVVTRVRADAVGGAGVEEAVRGADAVLSALGCRYTPRSVDVYSSGTRRIVEAMRAVARGRRLVVVSSGLTCPPPPMHWLADRVVLPVLRSVIGRTLYADMRRMEELLRPCDDIDWTIMRPGRLVDAASVSDYRLDVGQPTQGTTSRADLAAAMIAELDGRGHVHEAVAPTTSKGSRR